MSRRWIRLLGIGFGVLFLTVSIFTAVVVPVAKALSCDGWYGRACWYGYFKNSKITYGANVVNEGIPWITTKQSFLDRISSYLNSGNAQLTTAGQFIVLSMSGYQGGTAKSVSQAQWDDWVNRVNNPAVSMVVENALFECNIANSYYQTAFDDVAAGYSTPQEGCGAIDQMIDFYYNGVLVYRIRVACANPLGNLAGLPPAPPPIPPTVVQCGTMMVNANPRPEIGQPMSVEVYPAFYGGPSAPPAVTGTSIRVTGPGFDAWWPTVPNPPPPNGPGGGYVRMVSPSFTPPQPGTYTVTWYLTVNGVNSVPYPCGGKYAPGDSFEVMRYPFVEVKGGDVAAGSGIITDPSQTCGTPINNTNAGVTSWNRNSGAYPGAGGQYATFAWNFIQEFNTAKGSGRPPSYLAFSNQAATGQVNLGAGRYGGFGRQASCIDQWKDVPSAFRGVPNPTGVNLNSLDSTPYYHNGDLTIGANTLAAGKKVTIYVNGNARIAGDILYGGLNSTWANTAQIPSFKLIAKGVIYIGNTVNRIDGTYVAVPNTTGYTSFQNSYSAPRPGTISTCSNGFSVLNPAGGAGMINACNRRLEVNGSLAANQIFLLRTYGTMSDGIPAEQINFNPEVWLSPSGSKSIDPTYQSVVGLPPVL